MEITGYRTWQRLAKIYAPFMKHSDGLYDAIARRAAPLLSREMNVLELACGTGQLSFRLAGKARLWEATDFSPNMIAEARKAPRSSRLHFSVQDATALPYGAASFDAVMIANALHIMPEPDKALGEIFRVLKPGGVLMAPTFIHGESGAYRVKSAFFGLAGIRFYHLWTADELAAYVAGRGFEVVDAEVLRGGAFPLCYLTGRKRITNEGEKPQ